MSTPPRFVAALLGVLAVLSAAGCSMGSALPDPDSTNTAVVGPSKDGSDVALAAGTCWTADLAGADPQVVLRLSNTWGVSYFDAAHALAERPSFERTQSCGSIHAVEVYRALAIADVTPGLSGYPALLQTSSKGYVKLAAKVEQACMNKVLAGAAARTGLPGAVVQPAFPDGVLLGWSPPSADQWTRGQRVYACTMTQTRPGALRYAEVFTKAFPTAKRTCIDSKTLIYVDCARKHDRERIAVIDVSAAVAAGKFPGSRAIRVGPDGKYVDVSPAMYRTLDKACTAYLRSVSRTKKLSGVAEIDADLWPTRDGAYPVACEADAPTIKKSVSTQGSVYDRS